MAPEGAEIPVVRWTKKGVLICPVCTAPVGGPELGRDARLGRGTAQCKSKPGETHLFLVTDEAAIQVNKIWDRINGMGSSDGKSFIQNIEDNEPLYPGGGDGKIVLPG